MAPSQPIMRTSFSPDNVILGPGMTFLNQAGSDFGPANTSESSGSSSFQLPISANTSSDTVFEGDDFGSPISSMVSDVVAASSPSVPPMSYGPNVYASFLLGDPARQLSPFTNPVSADDMGSRLWSFCKSPTSPMPTTCTLT